MNVSQASTNLTAAAAAPLDPFVGHPLSPGVRVLILVGGSGACVTGILGNVLIISTVVSQPLLRRSHHNLYIGNLALVDLVVVGYSVPIWLLDVGLGRQPALNRTHCDFNAFLMMLAIGVSISTLTLVSFNRYLCACRPYLYARHCGRCSTLLSCLLAWLASALVMAVPWFRWGGSAFIYSRAVRMCTFDASRPNVTTHMASVIVPVLIVLVGGFSFCTLRKLKKIRYRVNVWTSDTGAVSMGQIPGQNQAGIEASPPPAPLQPNRANGTICGASPSDGKHNQNDPGVSHPKHNPKRNPDPTQNQTGVRVLPTDQTQNQRLAVPNRDPQRVLPRPRLPHATHSDIMLVWTFVLIFALLMMLYLPMMVAVAISGRVHISADTHNVFALLVFFNHAINWVVYGALNKQFRKGYKRLSQSLCYSTS